MKYVIKSKILFHLSRLRLMGLWFIVDTNKINSEKGFNFYENTIYFSTF